MTDMNSVIVPKSDQINSDDLIGGPRTIRITDVSISPGADQPVSIKYEGEAGKVWRPCKSMSRVLVAAWGPDAKQYVGRSVTLYRDPKVKWRGMEVGGIRVSHLSHIEREMQMALTETKGKRAPFRVKPLTGAASPPPPTVSEPLDTTAALSEGRMAAERGTAALGAWWNRLSPAEKTALKATLDDELKPAAVTADQATLVDGFPGDQTGEA